LKEKHEGHILRLCATFIELGNNAMKYLGLCVRKRTVGSCSSRIRIGNLQNQKEELGTELPRSGVMPYTINIV